MSQVGKKESLRSMMVGLVIAVLLVSLILLFLTKTGRIGFGEKGEDDSIHVRAVSEELVIGTTKVFFVENTPDFNELGFDGELIAISNNGNIPIAKGNVVKVFLNQDFMGTINPSTEKEPIFFAPEWFWQ